MLPADQPAEKASFDASRFAAIASVEAMAIIHALTHDGPHFTGALQRATGGSRTLTLRRLAALSEAGLVIFDEPPGNGKCIIFDVDIDNLLEVIEALADYLLPPDVVLRGPDPKE